MNNNESITASPSLKINLKEVNNNFQKKRNKKEVIHKGFKSFNAYNSGKPKKNSLIIKNDVKEQKVKEIQTYNSKAITSVGKTEEIYEKHCKICCSYISSYCCSLHLFFCFQKKETT